MVPFGTFCIDNVVLTVMYLRPIIFSIHPSRFVYEIHYSKMNSDIVL